MTSKQVSEQKDQLPAMGGMFEEDEAGGFEGADRDSYAIPFLQVLQKMSPQVDASEDGYVEGAKPGQFINTVTEQLFDGDEGIWVIPCHYERTFIEWVLRDSGGGFVADHGLEEGQRLMAQTTQDEKKRDILPNGNELMDTRVHYILIVHEDGSYEPAVFSATRTQIKGSRQWMTTMNQLKVPRSSGGMFTPPMFSHLYKLTTRKRSNDQGSWFVFDAKKQRMLGEGDEELYSAAKGFRDSVKTGQAKADHAKAADTGEAGSGNADPSEFEQDPDF